MAGGRRSDGAPQSPQLGAIEADIFWRPDWTPQIGLKRFGKLQFARMRTLARFRFSHKRDVAIVSINVSLRGRSGDCEFPLIRLRRHLRWADRCATRRGRFATYPGPCIGNSEGETSHRAVQLSASWSEEVDGEVDGLRLNPPVPFPDDQNFRLLLLHSTPSRG